MENTNRKLTDEQSSDLGRAVGIIYFITEKSVKGELRSWINRVGFHNYVAKLMEAQQILDGLNISDEDIATLLKGYHDRGNR